MTHGHRWEMQTKPFWIFDGKEDSSTAAAPSPHPALIYEWNAPLGASDPGDMFKDLCMSVGMELVN